MNDQTRWSDDRNGDRNRQEDYRSESSSASYPYGRGFGLDRYGNGNERNLAERGYGEGAHGRDDYAEIRQFYDRGRSDSAAQEDRSFTGGARTYDPYASGSGYGETPDRTGRYGSQSFRNSDRGQSSAALLNQGYRAPFAGVRGDAQGYSNQGYGARGYGYQGYEASGYGGYRGAGRSGYADDRPEYGAYAGQERGLWDQTRDEVSSWFGDDEALRRRRADDARHELQTGAHRGRGPKGYTRSDDRIREDVNDRLTDDHMLDASDIDVKVANGEVTLTGHIANRNDKRRAEDLADHIAGVRHVQNNLRVREPASTASTAASATQASGTTSSSTPRSN